MADETNKKSRLSIPVFFEKIADYISEDKRFTKVKIFLMHLGLNVNGSVFNKEAVDAAFPTLGYIPILGFIEKNSRGEDDFSNHRYVLVKNENGGLRRKYIGSAYGVVMSNEDNNAHYENRVCDDGVERTFVVVEGLMWNFLKGAEIMNRDVIKDHSMELFDDGDDSYEGYEDEDGNFVFTDFSFRGACILGNDAKYQPAMTGSTVEVQFAVSDFVKEIQSELNDKYSEFTRIVNDDKGKQQENSKEGGNDDMATDYAQTLMQQFSDIAKIVSDFELTKNRWGEAVPRFYLADIQENEVIIVDVQKNYQYYGCEFSVEGDKPVVKFETAKRKKITYADYVEGEAPNEGAFDFGTHISKIEETAFSKISEADEKVKEADEKVTKAEEDKAAAESNFTSLQEKYDEIKPKYDEYVKSENDRIEAENKESKNKLIAQFEAVLKDNEEFVAMKEHLDDYSVDEVETKCSIMYTRKNITTNFTSGNKGNSALGAITDDDVKSEHEGCVKTKYGWIHTSKK